MKKKGTILLVDTMGKRLRSLREQLFPNEYIEESRVQFYDRLFPKERIARSTKVSNVQHWESKEYIPLPVLHAVCNKCNVSADYMLGIQEEKNHDLHFVCDYLGLSETDLLNLKTVLSDKESMQGFSILLSNPYLAQDVFKHLYRAIEYRNTQKEAEAITCGYEQELVSAMNRDANSFKNAILEEYTVQSTIVGIINNHIVPPETKKRRNSKK